MFVHLNYFSITRVDPQGNCKNFYKKPMLKAVSLGDKSNNSHTNK